MSKILIGREKEQAVLQKALQSQEPEMIALIGRRRVGKTFLVKTIYKQQIVFELAGTQNASMREQLQSFSYQLGEFMGLTTPLKEPKNWLEAFHTLIQYLKQKQSKQKQVVFFDELPWLASPRSGFLKALSFFWNNWAVNQNIVVVICGSAASWMIRRVIHHKGGLHNRISRRIHLKPFTLAETEAYFQSKHISLNRYQIVQLYMAMGGVPHYLKEVEKGKSAAQNINDICFEETGLLSDEFSKLYPSLFEHSEIHLSVVRTLAERHQGMTRQEIISRSKLADGGGLSRVLDELVQSGFISFSFAYNRKKRDKIYRLIDQYSLFYLQFIEKNTLDSKNIWNKISQTQAYKVWSGYAFENICLQHISEIKEALRIGGIYSNASSFLKKGTATEEGTQIDLLIDRNDQVINIVEIKFYNEVFTISKEYATKLRQKLRVFQGSTQTRKQLMLVLLTTFGLKHNQHSLGLVENVLSLDDLFE